MTTINVSDQVAPVNGPDKHPRLRRFARQSKTIAKVSLACAIFPFTITKNVVLQRKKSGVRQRLLEAKVNPPKHIGARNSRHPESAAARSRDDRLLNHLASSENRYYISIAPRDGDVRGEHAYYARIDFGVDAQKSKLRPEDVVVAVDADYYMSPRQFISKSGHEFLFRTLVPEELSAIRSEYAYTHTPDGRVKMSVVGGSVYHHPRYDYDTDGITIPSPTTWATIKCASSQGVVPLAVELRNAVCGMFGKYKIHWMYKVDSIDTSEDHRIVGLTPYARVYNPKPKRTKGAAVFENTMIKPLARIAPAKGRYMMRRVHKHDGMHVQACSEDMYETIDILESDYFAMVAQHERLGPKLALSNTSAVANGTRIANKEPTITQGAGEVIYNLVKNNPFMPDGNPAWGKALIAINVPKVDDRRIATGCDSKNPQLADLSENKTNAKIIAPSMTNDPCCVSPQTQESLAHGVQERVLKVAADNNKAVPKEYEDYKRQFVGIFTKMIRVANTSYEESRNNLRTKRQKDRAAREEDDINQKVEHSIFEKSEVKTGLLKPARIIDSASQQMNIEMACYLKPIEEALRQYIDWYSPGNTPEETALQLRNFISGLKPEEDLIDTDFSKFDGSLSRFLRTIERDILLGLFHETEHGAIQRLWKSELDATMRSKSKKLKVKTESQRGSGTRGTTLWNTIINAFVAFCRNRKMGLGVTKAFNHIGPKYGDDSKEIGPALGLVQVCEDLQLKLTFAVECKAGPVSYLGRIYPSPLTNKGSIPDPLRLARKFHISFMKGDDRAVAKAKALAFLAVDEEVPLFGQFANWVVRRNRHITKVVTLDSETEYKLALGKTPKDFPDCTLEYIARSLNTTVEHCQKFIEMCDKNVKPQVLEQFFEQNMIPQEGMEPRVPV